MKVISLGWGVQSFTLAAMSALGELPQVDAVIHADTTHERSATYDFAKRWTGWLESHGIKVVTVRDRNTNIVAYNMVMIPAYTDSPKGGLLRRQCTSNWKIAPLRRWLQENRDSEKVEMWLGISLDEAERMRESDVQYIENKYPLIEKRMTRQACINWLNSHSLEAPPKSSCVFCPYHNAGLWRELKMTGNGDWSKAVKVDESIRKARQPYDLYLLSKKIPLSELGDNIDAQPSLITEECSGTCWV